jgi:hypothetical protein
MGVPTSPRDHLAWTTPAQAAWLIARGATFGTAFRICVIVGTLLTVVNQGGVIAAGQHGLVVLLRVLANYLIPYTVASIGYLAPFRSEHRSTWATPTSDRPDAGFGPDAAVRRRSLPS